MWHSYSNYSLLLIHFLSLQFSDLESLDSRGCGYSCVQESWKCTCLWMQNVINHLGAPEIICYTAQAFKGQFSLLSGVFEVSWNTQQVSHPGHGCQQLAPTWLCAPGSVTQSLSAALPHLLGTDMSFSGMKQHRSDCTDSIPRAMLCSDSWQGMDQVMRQGNPRHPCCTSGPWAKHR